jgi:hypothetical protein
MGFAAGFAGRPVVGGVGFIIVRLLTFVRLGE